MRGITIEFRVSYIVVRAGVCTALLISAAIVLAGCGGAGDRGLNDALSYFPADAPLVVAVNTDLDSGQVERFDQLAGTVPGWSPLKRRLITQLLGASVDFDRDIKPWLGDELVIGAGSAEDLFEGRLVAVSDTKDRGSVESFLDAEERSGLDRFGSYRGARLYKGRDGDTVVALNGDDLLLSTEVAALKPAIETAGSGPSFQGSALEAATASTESSLVRLYLDVGQVLSELKRSRRGTDLKRIAWLGSISTLGITASSGDRGLDFDLELLTGERDLSPADVPIATGRRSPKLLAAPDGFFSAGLRDLAQSIRFVEDSVRAVDPKGYGQYSEAKRVIGRIYGVDIDQDVIEQLKGDTAIVAGAGRVGAKVALQSPTRMQRSLGQTIPMIEAFLKGVGAAKRPEIQPRRQRRTVIYEMRDGGRLLARYGVVDRALVVALGGTSPFEIKTVPSGDAGSLAGRGALVLSLDLGRAIDLAAGGSVPRLLAPFIGFLRIRVTGSVRATTERVDAHVSYRVGS